MHNCLIILAAGASSRMKLSEGTDHLSHDEILEANNQSKTLIKIDDRERPILDYLLYNAKIAGYSDIYIVIGENADEFKQIYNKDHQKYFLKGLKISFPIQYIPKGRSKPFGTADAVFQTLEQFPELKKQSFTVCNGDNLYSIDALKSLRINNFKNAFIAYDEKALNFSHERILKFAILLLDQNFCLIDISEKPKNFNPEVYKDQQGVICVSMNIFKFNGPMFYPYLKDCPVNTIRNEKELPSAVLNMAKDIKGSIIGIPFSEHVPDLTSKEDIIILKKYIAENYSKFKFNKI